MKIQFSKHKKVKITKSRENNSNIHNKSGLKMEGDRSD